MNPNNSCKKNKEYIYFYNIPLLSAQRLNGFFHDATSFNIAIDMLFTKGHYESKWQTKLTIFFPICSWTYCTPFLAALEVLRIMKSQNVPFNKDTLTLAFGTCYKLVRFK